jgi:hypothetical protein
MSSFSLQDNAELQSSEQNYGDDPLADRESDLYRGEFVMGFVEKWDELIEAYPQLVARGYEYGPAFRGLRSVWSRSARGRRRKGRPSC